jgi:hypothetical protein
MMAATAGATAGAGECHQDGRTLSGQTKSGRTENHAAGVKAAQRAVDKALANARPTKAVPARPGPPGRTSGRRGVVHA